MSRPSRGAGGRQLVATELAAPPDDLVAVVQEDLEQLLEAEGARLAVDQSDVVDAEGVLHRRLLVELLEQHLRDEPVLHLDDQAGAVVLVGQVDDVGDAWSFLACTRVLIFSTTFSMPTA